MRGTKLAIIYRNYRLLLQHNAAIGAASRQTTILFPLLSNTWLYLIISRYTKAPSQAPLVYLSTVYSAITTNYTVTITPMRDVFTSMRIISSSSTVNSKRKYDHFPHQTDAANWSSTAQTRLIDFLFSFFFFFPDVHLWLEFVGCGYKIQVSASLNTTKANLGVGGILPIWSVPARIRRFEPDSQNRIESSRSNFTQCRQTIYSYITIVLDRSRLIVYRCPYRVSLCLTHHPHPAFLPLVRWSGRSVLIP